MKGIAMTTVIVAILGVLVLAVISGVFLLGLQLSPLDARKTFSEGCLTYCTQISDRADASGERIEVVAVQLAEELRGSLFIQACNFLYPDTTGYPYLCWNRDCCKFNVPRP